MSDTAYPVFQHYGTNAQRLAFTPAPAAGTQPIYIWYESDTDKVFAYTTAWHQISSGSSGSAISALTGDVTATGPGSVAATIANNAVTTAKINNAAVTLAKIANAAANDKLLGSGNSGSGAAYTEITLGTGLTMTGTTLSSSGGSGTVTTTGSPASGNLTKFSGASSVTNADLTGDVTTSGAVATTIANSAVTLAKIANAAANSKLLGSGASGSGAAYTELTLGTNLSMSGTTLNATGGSSGAWTQLSQVVTSGSQATVDFTSIAGGYSYLYVIWDAQALDSGTSVQAMYMKVNNDGTSGNYTSSARIGTTSGTSFANSISASSSGMFVAFIPQSGNTGLSSHGTTQLIGYAGTTFNKVNLGTYDFEAATDGIQAAMIRARWKSSSAITRLTYGTDGTGFTNGSVFTLYGIT